MGIVEKEPIACFNPFEMEEFACPNCGSTKFVELTPYGGVWCSGCNMEFEMLSTCDGIRKVAVRGSTEHCWNAEHRKLKNYGTTIWEGDDSIHWLKFTHDGNLER